MGYTAFTVEATDADGFQIQYTIHSETPPGFFGLNSVTSGVIILKQELDFSIHPSHILVM